MEENRHQEIIRRSHERSGELGIDKNQAYPLLMLDQDRLKNLISGRKKLLDIAAPHINDLMEILGENHGFIALLTDDKGIIFHLVGDKDAIEDAKAYKMVEGASMNESSVGTNAMGTAILERKPVQVTAEEHFVTSFQRWTCSAAPFFDPAGRLIGILNLSAKKEKTHPHTLGLVSAAAKAIEESIRNQIVTEDLYEARQFAFSIMNQLSYGLIAINKKDEIQWVNDTACRSLNIRRTEFLTLDITTLIPSYRKIKSSVLHGHYLLDEEMRINYPEVHEKYLCNAFSMRSEAGANMGITLTFRPLSRMVNLFNKFTAKFNHYSFRDIITQSRIMQKSIEYAQTVAKSPSTILITGESGTGKEVFAQAIHNQSERSAGPFVAINCGAISSTLIESELFGYEEGAFTGARKGGMPGKFELAAKGTLFLDEIGEMPPDMQVKLLRSLQEKQITRLGGSETISVNVRIIAATNKDLKHEISEGRFREDLYYRISVIPIHLPALRERPEDVPLLFRHFLESKAAMLNKPIPEINDDLRLWIQEHNWPGNVRELENMAEKIVLLNGFVEPDVPLSEKANHREAENSHLVKFEAKTLEEHEKQCIAETLIECEGNISKTASILGIGRNTLYQKIRKYDLKH